MGKGVYRTSVHSFGSYILLVPLKQLLKFGSQTTTHACYVKHILDRDVATGGSGEQGGHAHHLHFNFQTRCNSFSFKHQRYCFLRVFRNYADQKLHDIYRLCYKLQRLSIISNYIGETDHFTLDLLKWSDT